MNKEQFIKEIRNLGCIIDENMLSNLDKYYQLLYKYNQVMNLTTIIEESDVYLKHFYDSLTLVKVHKFEDNINVLDVGTGAGFPGMVLSILKPNINVYLLDSNTKRLNFLEIVKNELNLNNVTIINRRAEELDKKYIDFFDLVVSRAVANLQILSELCIPYVKVEGYFISLKGNVSKELELSKNIISKLNGKITSVTEFYLPIENSIRNIVVIKKINKNNPMYPRKYDKIKKSIAK